ncbi:MAG: sialidase family protein [Planctomycetota bacterium]
MASACLSLATLAEAQRAASTIAAAGSQTYPVIATNGAVTWVVWTDFVHAWCSGSTDGGATWTGAVGVDRSQSCRAGDARIALTTGAVHVVWTGSSSCGPFAPFDIGIRYNRSTDNGTTWLPADALLSGSPLIPAYRPQIAAFGSKLFVVWEDNRVSVINVYFSRSLDAGTTWSPPVRLDTDLPTAAHSTRPRLVATGSTVCVTWVDGRHGVPSVYCNRSLDDGTTWLAADVRVNNGTIPGQFWANEPEITADGLSVCIVWRDNRHWTTPYGSDADIFANRSLDGGATWATDGRVGPGPTSGVIQCLEARTARNGSTVHVAWLDKRGGVWDPFAKRSLDGGATWLPVETRLNGGQVSGVAFAMMPVIAATPAVVSVAWLGFPAPPSYYDLFSNRSVDGGATWAPVETRLDTTPAGSSSSSFHALAAAGDTVRATWIEGSSIVANLPFGFVRRGTGMAGTGGFVPLLAGNGLPVIGGAFTIDLNSGLGGTIGVLAVGDPTAAVSIPLFGGTLLVSPILTLTAVLGGTSPGTGTWSQPIVVPATGALLGFGLDLQMLLLDAGSPSGFVFTNAVEAWIG